MYLKNKQKTTLFIFLFIYFQNLQSKMKMLVELLQAGESASRGMIEFTSQFEILDSHSNENEKWIHQYWYQWKGCLASI